MVVSVGLSVEGQIVEGSKVGHSVDLVVLSGLPVDKASEVGSSTTNTTVVALSWLLTC